ncbi:UNKNOWN [Stylonychia lemnae]|uniref:Cadg domain containing protein n=1 Tax=Stylonychia lemnae TaxID=5949 RepID=A0A078AME4_STYLE|nr:UNKNOWN [Stylonychia lemnae]|eukprot:CDW83081.1 UNKNOWN [Stylonychia lemnae]
MASICFDGFFSAKGGYNGDTSYASMDYFSGTQEVIACGTSFSNDFVIIKDSQVLSKPIVGLFDRGLNQIWMKQISKNRQQKDLNDQPEGAETCVFSHNGDNVIVQLYNMPLYQVNTIIILDRGNGTVIRGISLLDKNGFYLGWLYSPSLNIMPANNKMINIIRMNEQSSTGLTVMNFVLIVYDPTEDTLGQIQATKFEHQTDQFKIKKMIISPDLRGLYLGGGIGQDATFLKIDILTYQIVWRYKFHNTGQTNVHFEVQEIGLVRNYDTDFNYLLLCSVQLSQGMQSNFIIGILDDKDASQMKQKQQIAVIWYSNDISRNFRCMDTFMIQHLQRYSVLFGSDYTSVQTFIVNVDIKAAGTQTIQQAIIYGPNSVYFATDVLFSLEGRLIKQDRALFLGWTSYLSGTSTPYKYAFISTLPAQKYYADTISFTITQGVSPSIIDISGSLNLLVSPISIRLQEIIIKSQNASVPYDLYPNKMMGRITYSAIQNSYTYKVGADPISFDLRFKLPVTCTPTIFEYQIKIFPRVQPERLITYDQKSVKIYTGDQYFQGLYQVQIHAIAQDGSLGIADFEINIIQERISSIITTIYQGPVFQQPLQNVSMKGGTTKIIKFPNVLNSNKSAKIQISVYNNQSTVLPSYITYNQKQLVLQPPKTIKLNGKRRNLDEVNTVIYLITKISDSDNKSNQYKITVSFNQTLETTIDQALEAQEQLFPNASLKSFDSAGLLILELQNQSQRSNITLIDENIYLVSDPYYPCTWKIESQTKDKLFVRVTFSQNIQMTQSSQKTKLKFYFTPVFISQIYSNTVVYYKGEIDIPTQLADQETQQIFSVAMSFVPLMNLNLPSNLYYALSLMNGPLQFNFVNLQALTQSIFGIEEDDKSAYNYNFDQFGYDSCDVVLLLQNTFYYLTLCPITILLTLLLRSLKQKSLRQNTTKSFSLLFTPLYLARRIIFALSIVFLDDGLIQALIFFLGCLVQVGYLVKVKPFYSKLSNQLEIFNEACILVISIFILTFTDAFPYQAASYEFGWIVLALCFIICLVNIGIQVYTVSMKITLWVEKKKDEWKLRKSKRQTVKILSSNVPWLNSSALSVSQNDLISEQRTQRPMTPDSQYFSRRKTILKKLETIMENQEKQQEYLRDFSVREISMVERDEQNNMDIESNDSEGDFNFVAQNNVDYRTIERDRKTNDLQISVSNLNQFQDYAQFTFNNDGEFLKFENQFTTLYMKDNYYQKTFKQRQERKQQDDSERAALNNQ